MASQRSLTRDQLAKFLPTPELIKAFENLFRVVSELQPENLDVLLQDIALNAGASDSKAEAGLNRAPSFDYVDFSKMRAHSNKVGRLGWDNVEDTLHIDHGRGVLQPIGLKSLVRVSNFTGITIPKMTVVGFGGADDDHSHIKVLPYAADGSVPSLYALGVSSQDLPDTGEHGFATVFGQMEGLDTTGTPVGETWALGDILYADPITPGALTNVKPTAPNVVIPFAAVLNVDSVAGVIFIRPTIEQQLYYGAFIKTTDQTPAAADTAYAITFDTETISNGVHIDPVVASRIVIDNSGLYTFSASFQLASGSSSVKNVWLWFRKNGTDVTDSSLKVSLESGNALSTPSRSVFFSLDADDYIELMWASDSTNVTLDTIASTAFAPAAPACILTVDQIQQ